MKKYLMETHKGEFAFEYVIVAWVIVSAIMVAWYYLTKPIGDITADIINVTNNSEH
jgi:hypothetical protein